MLSGGSHGMVKMIILLVLIWEFKWARTILSCRTGVSQPYWVLTFSTSGFHSSFYEHDALCCTFFWHVVSRWCGFVLFFIRYQTPLHAAAALNFKQGWLLSSFFFLKTCLSWFPENKLWYWLTPVVACWCEPHMFYVFLSLSVNDQFQRSLVLAKFLYFCCWTV